MTQMFGSFGKQMLLSSWSTFFNVVAKFQSDTLAWFDDKQVYKAEDNSNLRSDRFHCRLPQHNQHIRESEWKKRMIGRRGENSLMEV